MREIRTPRSVGTWGGRPPPVTRWMWKRSHGRTSEAPPAERGGYRYVRPTATASHLDSTLRGPSPGEYGSNSPPITPHLRRRLPNHRPLLWVPSALGVASAPPPRRTPPFSADRQSAGRYTSLCSRSGGPVITLPLTPKSPIRETPFYG